MKISKSRYCPLCGNLMKVVEGSQRTTPDKVYFVLRCPTCGHEDTDWHERRNGKTN